MKQRSRIQPSLPLRSTLAPLVACWLVLATGFAFGCGDAWRETEAQLDEDIASGAAALSPEQPRMSANVYHPSVHLDTNYKSAAEVTMWAQKIKELVFGSSASPTCYTGPSGKAQLAVQTEFIPPEYANNANALALLDARLDALFDQGLAVHLLLPVHQVRPADNMPASWQGVNWSTQINSWPNTSTFVPVKPCPTELVNGAKCPYDVLFDNFQRPIIEHLVATGRAQKLAVIYVMNEFGYHPDIMLDTAVTWGNVANWKLKRAEALAYTASRALSKARVAAAGTVPVGIKFASVGNTQTGWAPDAVHGTDQLSYILNDVMGPGGDVLGYDVYFNPGDPYDNGNKVRLSPFLPTFASGRFEIAEFGRICSGSPGQFDIGSRTTVGDITGAAAFWSPAKALNLFAFNASGSPGGCYSLTDPSNPNTVYAGAGSEAAGMWALVKNVTGSLNPSACSVPCAAIAIPAAGGNFSGTTSGPGALSGSCGGGAAGEKVYAWTPAVSGSATIKTCGSTLDTLVHVHTGSCGGAEVACNDDSCGVGSQITLNVTAGVTYYIVVDGYSGNGAYSLTVTPPGAQPGTCASPIPLPSSGGSVSGTTSGVSALTGSCGGNGAEKVYSWTPTSSGVASFSTCGSSLDTVVHVRKTSCLGGQQVGCVDDSCGLGSQVSVNVTAGTTYYAVVDSYSSGGSYSLTVTPP